MQTANCFLFVMTNSVIFQ